jgi:hypothetical protein
MTGAAALCIFVAQMSIASAQGEEVRRLPVDEYVDKMQAGWIGQMAGVGFGDPTEFRWPGEIIPEDKMPAWEPGLINQFSQDDIYVEMTFLRTLELHGLNVSIRQAGIDFANSGYKLWHANVNGRANLRKGIAPPDSGHPEFNSHADDIDYQIEADYAGLISPGLPNSGVRLGELFGRLMNYGDGLYGGQFVSAMYSAAFFEPDMEKVVRAGLACVPQGSQFHECISDMLRWHQQQPDDWQAVWRLVEAKYQDNRAYRRFSCTKEGDPVNIDAKINAAYIVMGLLYGEGDLDRTMVISTRCGQDSDCNPSNAAGILFTSVGLSKIPDRFVSALDNEGKFSHTPYDFPKLVAVCEDLARQVVVRHGGRIERDAAGREAFIIPVEEPKPSALEQCWEPGPIAGSRFTEKEQARIDPLWKRADEAAMAHAIAQLAPGWQVNDCGDDMDPGLRDAFRGRKNVLLTHPLDEATPCRLTRKVSIPESGATLRLEVGRHDKGDWLLIVKANGKALRETIIGADTTEEGWKTIEISLAEYAGSELELELLNMPNGWEWEGAYWAEIAVVTE